MPFKPGQSGNPSGRPKVNFPLRENARIHTQDMLEVLLEVARDKTAPHTARVTAANAILDRAWGKPAQAITGEDGEGPVQITGLTVSFVKPEE